MADAKVDEGIRRTGLFSLGKAEAEEPAVAVADTTEKEGSLPGRLFRSLLDRRSQHGDDAKSQDPFLTNTETQTPTTISVQKPQSADTQRERLIAALEGRTSHSEPDAAMQKPWWQDRSSSAMSSRGPESRMSSKSRQSFVPEFDSRLEALRSELMAGPVHSAKSPEVQVVSFDPTPALEREDLATVAESDTNALTDENPFAAMTATPSAAAEPAEAQPELTSRRAEMVALMAAARQELEGWRLDSAEEHALAAYQIAAAEGISIAAVEEHPADLLALIVEEKRRDDATRSLTAPFSGPTSTSAESTQPVVASVNTAAFKNFPNVFGEPGWQAVTGQSHMEAEDQDDALLHRPYGSTESEHAEGVDASATGGVNLLPPDSDHTDYSLGWESPSQRGFAGTPEVSVNSRVELVSAESEDLLAHYNPQRASAEFGLTAAEGLDTARSAAAANRQRVLTREAGQWLTVDEAADAATFDRSRPVRVAAAPPLSGEPQPIGPPAESLVEATPVETSGWFPATGWLLLLVIGVAVALRMSSRRWRLLTR